MGKTYDVAVIGGGVIGCAIARELSRFALSVCLLERDEDVCSGTSKANSAIVHAGFDALPGTSKAKFNVDGNAMMDKLAKDLDFEFKRNGSLVLCFDEQERPNLEELYQRGIKNGVPGVKIISGDEAREMEPHVSKNVVAALYAPTGGIVCPFGMTIALAENACKNGVDFYFLTEVVDIKKENGFRVSTGKEEFTCKYIVNAAGVYADVIHNMVSEKDRLHIVPRRGEYMLLDKEAGGHVSHTIFQLPGKYGKGILVTPTVHGNLLVGPTAVDQEDKECIATTGEGLDDVIAKASISVDEIPFRKVITSFSGLRAHEDGDEFIIGEHPDAEGFFDAAGIESPGLSSAPAIGVYIAEAIAQKAGAAKKADFKEERKGFVKAAELPVEERAKLIAERPEYGTIICRCENISEGEIMDAINRPLGARSMDAIKRRVRQGMGRCQGGFCTPRTMEILSRETGIPMESICKNRPGSELIKG